MLSGCPHFAAPLSFLREAVQKGEGHQRRALEEEAFRAAKIKVPGRKGASAVY
jgi:hypothetical protein